MEAIRRRSLFVRLAGLIPMAILPISARAKVVASRADEAFPAEERFSLLYQRLQRAEEDAERREVSLAGVSAAATGATGALNTAQRGDWEWHPAYQDALDLRRKFECALRMISERIPSGQQIMLYPCGCAALGNLPDGEILPLDCGSEGHERGAASIVCGLPAKPRPTIEELESILAQDGIGPAVTILPNGQVIA